MIEKEFDVTVHGVTFHVLEAYEDYDPRFCCNGGSYFQPLYRITDDDGNEMTISDTSCGDFGTRIECWLYLTDGRSVSAYWGTMDDDWFNYSNFQWAIHIHRLWMEVADQLGYHIPNEF